MEIARKDIAEQPEAPRSRLVRLLGELLSPHVVQSRGGPGRPPTGKTRQSLLGIHNKQWSRFVTNQAPPFEGAALTRAFSLCTTEVQRLELENAWYADTLAWYGLGWEERTRSGQTLRAVQQAIEHLRQIESSLLKSIQDASQGEVSSHTLSEIPQLVIQIQALRLATLDQIKRLLDCEAPLHPHL